MRAIGEKLKGFEKTKVPTVNKNVSPWAAPRRVETTCALDPSKVYILFAIQNANHRDKLNYASSEPS